MGKQSEEWIKHIRERSTRWLSLTGDKRLELALALIRRPNRPAEGFDRLRRFFPAAPESMLRTAAWHLYSEAPRAVVDFLAEVELSLRDDDPHYHGPAGVEVLYHFYNFLQFEALVPHGLHGLGEVVEDIKECVEDGDKAGALENLKGLASKLDACESAPDFD